LLKIDPKQKIVFAENSGWSMECIKEKLPKFDPNRLEFISFPPDLFDISRGKGYNELLLINLAIERSSFIQECGAFFKVTGRYPIFNIHYFIIQATKAINNGTELYCDIKDHQLFDLLHLGWCGHSADTRLFGVKTPYYNKNIGSHYTEVDDYNGPIIEGFFFQLIKNESKKGINKFTGDIGNGRIKCRFPKEPQFGGMEGSYIVAGLFSADQNSLTNKMKRLVGNGFRKLLPWIWI
jgi:hypothetical protein